MTSSAPVRPPQRLDRRTLSATSTAALGRIAQDLAAQLGSSPLADVADAVDRRLPELPAELSATLRPPGDLGAVIIDGLTVDDAELGPTPSSWREVGTAGREFELALLLLARCAGEPFGWRGQQQGRLINSIVPSRGQEQAQTGASSATTLSPHTEDAFHPRRAHLMLLGCLRNPDRVGTTVSSIRRVELDDDQQQTLTRPVLPILPDDTYGGDHDQHSATPTPTVWPGPDGLTLRYDPAYTPLERADADYLAAYTHLAAELDRVRVTAVLDPGELLLIDNDVAVHGRVPFTARYDGTDRWLKRVNIRLPQRERRPEEATEDGYGEQLVEPFAVR